MKNINKKTIIYISLTIIIVVLGYYIFIKEDDDYSENNLNLIINQEDKEISRETIEKDSINKIIVYITGAINNEGVYDIEENSRIADIIEKAGGLKENANVKNINLAYKIEDGMKIHIPAENEIIDEIADETNIYIINEKNNLQNSNEKKSTSNNKININTATQTELETLPGVGPSTALKIIEYRKENGKFNNIEDIKKVSGIGDSKYSKVKDLIKI